MSRLDLAPLRKLPPDTALSAISEYLTDRLATGKNGPCVFCGGTDRARWCLRTGRYYCSQCQSRYMSALDMYIGRCGLPFREAVEAFAARVGVTLDSSTTPARPHDRRGHVDRIVSQCQAIRSSDPYSRHTALRGLNSDMVANHQHIRHCDRLRHTDGSYHPAMVALLYRSGSLVKIQRTYLTADGNKAVVDPVRASLAACADHMGAVVPVSMASGGDISSLAIGEGVETMLAVSQAVSMPTVAACDAGNMERFTPPADTKALYVAVDNDESRRGEQAYHALAARLCRERPDIRVLPVTPPRVGSDWADYDQAEIAAAWQEVYL